MGPTGFSKNCGDYLLFTIYLSAQCNILEECRRGLQGGRSVWWQDPIHCGLNHASTEHCLQLVLLIEQWKEWAALNPNKPIATCCGSPHTDRHIILHYNCLFWISVITMHITDVIIIIMIIRAFACCWRSSPQWVRASSFTRFLDHTQRRTTVCRTSLEGWSARRRHIYLTTHNNHNRQTSMHPVGFEPTISAAQRPQTCSLDRHF